VTTLAPPIAGAVGEQAPGRVPAWPFVLGFVLLMALLLLAGKGGVVRLAYPAGALIIGAWLYGRGPAGYLEFSWWLWHVSPGIRRIVDYQTGGWDPRNPMSLTPFLVSGLAAIGVVRRLPELRRRRLLPWAVAIACLAYGYCVGLLRAGPLAATHALVTWLVPLGFGLYCALEWRRYPECAGAVRRAFLFGSLVLALYGIWQFLDPPPWDRIWMVSSGMYSVGRAFPYEVRVFSLVNAPLPFATILVGGLLVALSGRGAPRVASLALGTIALLLSLVRSVWLAGLVGIVVYLASLPARAARPLVTAALLVFGTVAAVPLLAPAELAEPTVRIVRDRLLTFTDLRHDVSFEDRTSFLDNIATTVVDEPLGQGLGSTGVSSTLGGADDAGIRDFDNGVFAVLYSLGWVGGVGFLAAALAVLLLSLRRREPGTDWTAKAARAVVVTSLLLALGANVFEGVSAAVLWAFAGLLSAAHQWHSAAGEEEPCGSAS
jgi:O-Antigen ligase